VWKGGGFFFKRLGGGATGGRFWPRVGVAYTKWHLPKRLQGQKFFWVVWFSTWVPFGASWGGQGLAKTSRDGVFRGVPSPGGGSGSVCVLRLFFWFLVVKTLDETFLKGGVVFQPPSLVVCAFPLPPKQTTPPIFVDQTPAFFWGSLLPHFFPG